MSLELLDVKVTELEKRIELHLEYQRKAVTKASDELHERLAGMNEFRETLKDQASRFVTTTFLDERLLRLDERLTALELRNANMDGRFWVWGIFITILTLVLQLWPLLRH